MACQKYVRQLCRKRKAAVPLQYVIGIDGGGTKTHLKALTRRRTAVGEAWGGASNLTALPRGQVEENLSRLLTVFFADSGLDPADCAGLCLGTAGAGSPLAREALRTMLEGMLPGVPVQVTNDALPALYGGTLTGCGVILIAGTGSICLARNAAGEIWRTGGWGHILGDEGSGYAVSAAMLRAVLEAYDKRGPETLLTGLVLEHLGVSGPMDVVNYVYHSGKGKSELASLAFLCDIAYNKGDISAQKILRNAAEELGRMAGAAASAVGLDRMQGTPCVCSGGMAVHSGPLRQELAAYLAREAPGLSLQECREDAAYGCALLAMEDEGAAS